MHLDLLPVDNHFRGWGQGALSEDVEVGLVSVIKHKVSRPRRERGFTFAGEAGSDGNAEFFFVAGFAVGGDDSANPYDDGVHFWCSGGRGWQSGDRFASGI